MLSSSHDNLVELFRQRGELAPALLRACAAIDLRHHHVEPATIDFTQATPAEYRGDCAVRLTKRDGTTSAAVITEVQLRPDDDKRFTWPLYVAALRARMRCPVYLLVLAPDQATARWANTEIALGHPGFVFRPIVVSFSDVPRILNASEANQLPELAVLSSLAHPDPEIASTALRATRHLPEDDRKLYTDLILSGLSQESRRQLEAYMKEPEDPSWEYEHEWSLFHQPYLQGRAAGLHAAVLELARDKMSSLSPDDEAALKQQHDQAALTRLIHTLGRATNTSQARKAFDAALLPAQAG